MADPHAICRKWVARLGGGFHPDTRGKDYTPAMSKEEIAEYDADMDTLFEIEGDPYEYTVKAIEDAGLKTLTVIGPTGTEVTVLKPRSGSVCVIAKAGSTIRGTTYFRPTLLNLSENFAKHLAGEGVVEIATVVEG